jgi:hypothetical protein
MLACLLAMVCSAGVRGQYNYNANNEYTQMHKYAIRDNSSYNSSPYINLTMECLAANGYGQWTVSSDVGTFTNYSGHPWDFSPDPSYSHNEGWFLLSNLLAEPSEKGDGTSTNPGCQPPGIISGGQFSSGSQGSFTSLTYPSTPKVTANLHGNVRYVLVSGDRQSFNVQGLNGTLENGTHSKQVDITLDGLPNATLSRKIVKAPIDNFGASTTNSHPVVSSTDEADFRDRFDITCDQNFIYIVWCSKNGNNFEIWCRINHIHSNIQATAPFLVSSNAGGVFKRPTVACNVRNSGSSFCAIGYLATAANVTVPVVATIINGGVTNTEALLLKHHDPYHYNNVSFPDITYFNALHARILVSSVAGASSGVLSMYVLTNYGLLLYDKLTGTNTNDIAWYCDGHYANFPPAGVSKPYPMPIPNSGSNPPTVETVDEHIVAFANPYDNQDYDGTSSHPFKQFHCLYRLTVHPNSGSNKNPLCIIRSFDNGWGGNHQDRGDQRVLLNRHGDQSLRDFSLIDDDPTSYVGAVNQMGVHIHWRIGGSTPTHFYVRDIRSFDEDIEEMTLATNTCTITDGRDHGGTQDAKVLDGLKFTLWTDPNYGASSTLTTSGLYRHSPTIYSGVGIYDGSSDASNTGVLKFLQYGEYFIVGQTNGATFYTMPNCLIKRYPTTSYNDEIHIEKNSKWKYFGLPSSYNSVANLDDGITVKFNGYSSSATANLDIQPGGEFWNSADVEATHGVINILNGNSVAILPGATDVTADALFTDDHTASLSNSVVNSYAAASTEPTVMKITGTGSGALSSEVSLLSVTTDYNNLASIGGSAGGGIGIVQYNVTGNGGYSPDKVTFDGGNITRIRFLAYDPQIGGLEFQNLTINDFSGYEIWIKRTTNYDNDYADILVQDNIFTTNSSGIDGIRLDNFNNSNNYFEVNIIHNDFSNGTDDDDWGSAIHLVNTTGNILRNKIVDPHFTRGIHIESTAGFNFDPTFAFVCNNYIRNVDQGIFSDHYRGYVKLNQILYCDAGYASQEGDNPKIVFTSITNCYGPGIYIIENISVPPSVDLTGIHEYTSTKPSPFHDIAAFDTIAGNVIEPYYSLNGQITFGTVGGVVKYGHLFSWWTEWGKDNTYSTFGITGGSVNPLIIAGDGTNNPIADVDNNYWGSGIDPACTTCVAGGWNTNTGMGSEVNCTADFTATAGKTVPMTGFTDQIMCGSNGTDCTGDTSEIIRAKGNLSLSFPQQDTPGCTWLRQWRFADPQNQKEAIESYDSVRYYIERCAAGDDQSYQAFSGLNGAVYLYAPKDSERYNRYRDWLISVLYLNTTSPFYYCSCIGSIAGTYGVYSSGRYNLHNAGLAVIDFLRHTKCASPGLDSQYQREINHLKENGEDTTLPTLEQIGLGFLLKSSSPSPISFQSIYLESFISSPNPFIKETTLEFTLNRMAYTTIAIYDELGRLVWGDGKGSSLEAGLHTVHIDGKGLPHGTLYARISTGFGEVKTVKLVHE